MLTITNSTRAGQANTDNVSHKTAVSNQSADMASGDEKITNNKFSGLVKRTINRYKRSPFIANNNAHNLRNIKARSPLKEKNPFGKLISDLVTSNSCRFKTLSFIKVLMSTKGLGDIVGKCNMPEDFPDIRPAQEAVIPYVLEQKMHYVNASSKPIIIDVWQNPKNKAIYIQDGQHRFVAACLLGKSVVLKFKKMGFPAFNGNWENTRYVDTVAAKDRMKL